MLIDDLIILFDVILIILFDDSVIISNCINQLILSNQYSVLIYIGHHTPNVIQNLFLLLVSFVVLISFVTDFFSGIDTFLQVLDIFVHVHLVLIKLIVQSNESLIDSSGLFD